MVNSVLKTVEKFDMIQNGDKMIVALSGGADSVTLLDILYSFKEKYNLTLYAAHVNHGLRGEEANRDENFCKILCRNYNTKLFIKNINIRELATRQKISEELCGRNERYAFFDELSKTLGAKVATAHTASDNAETLIFNLTRGMSVAGAAAIPPTRENIIRPLIERTREEIEAYCTERRLEYVSDSTNLSDTYTRNKIRHSVIPVLKEINPDFDNAAARFSQSAAETADFLRQSAEKLIKESRVRYGYRAQHLLDSHTAVTKAAIVLLCGENHFVPERRHIELILGILKNSGAVELSKSHTAVCKQGIFRIVGVNAEKNELNIALKGEMSFFYLGRSYIVAIDDKNNSLLENNSLVIRTRKGGDTFTFPKRKVTKPLGRALNEQKIPSELRDCLPVVCRGSTVLWCESLGYSEQGLTYRKKYQLTIKIDE